MKKPPPKKEARIPFTREGFEKIKAEHEKHLAERPDAVENLRKAREMGDLRENGYYKAARQRLSFLDAQLRRTTRLIKLGVIIAPHDSGRVEIGSNVTITDNTSTVTYKIVGGYESNPLEKTVSHVSPIGRALMGKRKGESITVQAPKGELRYTIVDVST